MTEGLAYPYKSIEFVTGDRFTVGVRIPPDEIAGPDGPIVKEIKVGTGTHPAFMMIYIVFEEDVPDRIFQAFPGTFVIECSAEAIKVDTPSSVPTLVVPTSRLREV